MNGGLEQELEAYIRQYRDDGVLLDTNVLLLLWAHRFDPQLVGGKRLEKYDIEAAQLLMRYVGQFQRILTTSAILAEVSNFAGLMLSGKKKSEFFAMLHAFFNAPTPKEVEHCSIHGIELPIQVFVKLGYTDTSILSVAKTPHFLLTDDLDLYVEAQINGLPAIHFPHLLEAAWAFD